MTKGPRITRGPSRTCRWVSSGAGRAPLGRRSQVAGRRAPPPACSRAAADQHHPSHTADGSAILGRHCYVLMEINLGPQVADLIRLGRMIDSLEAGAGADGVGHGRLSPPSEQLLAQDTNHPTEPADPADASHG
jgi:hypothetical protein